MRRLAPVILSVCVLLASCDGARGAPVLPTIMLGQPTSPVQAPQQVTGGVVASAIVVSERSARLAMPTADRVKAVYVNEGDTVLAGQALTELEGEAARAAVAQATAALQGARVQYDILVAGPTAEQVRAAQGAVDAAQAVVDRLLAGPRPEQVTIAEAALASAQARLAALRKGPDATALAMAEMDVDQAKNALWAAQAGRDGICGNTQGPGYLCDAAQAQVATAETAVRQAEARLARAKAGPAAEEIAQAQAAVTSAQAQLALAKNPFTIHEVSAARAQLAQAQAQLDGIRAGATSQQRAAAQAQVDVAEAQLAAAEVQASRLVLLAPFAGTITAVHVEAGEYAQPGQALLALADLAHLRVETTDLSERDVPRVAVGQSVAVEIPALGKTIPGRVAFISPVANTLGGDVVYRTAIELAETPQGLRAGMSAHVRFAE